MWVGVGNYVVAFVGDYSSLLGIIVAAVGDYVGHCWGLVGEQLGIMWGAVGD